MAEKARPSTESQLHGAGRSFGIVAARFNGEIVGRLLEGAEATLERHGVAEADRTVLRVPGAWEIPQALASLAKSGEFDALLALGAVIRGETDHYEAICRGCTDGCMRVALEHGVPVALGVLTCQTVELAEARAGGDCGNKGTEAALAALEMAGHGAEWSRLTPGRRDD